MTETERLQAEKACRDIVLSAARAVDDQDYRALAALFAPDGELVRPGGTPLVGPEAILASYAAKDPERLTRHIVCNHQVTVDSDAAARSSCVVILWTSQRSEELTPRGRLADAMQGGDNLHPNGAGETAMGEAVPLGIFR